MFIELVESLRCPRSHEFTWLVASTLEMAGRDIRRGLLGCPSCGARYTIRDGVVDFRTRDGTTPIPDSGTLPAPNGDAEAVTRLAALLDLATPGGFIVLVGEHAHHAPGVRDAIDGVEILVLNATAELASGDGISLTRTEGALPLRPGAARGIVLDERHAARAAEAGMALRANGRLIAPSTATLPSDLEELARDEREWVGTKRTTTSEAVPLRRKS